MAVRLIDIAKLAGVSKATASRALAGSELVHPETRQRIADIARELNYRPNSLAQAVATKRSGMIGFLIYKKDKPYFGHTFYGPVLDGAVEEAKRLGYHIVLSPANDERGNTFDERLINNGVDGSILISFDPSAAVEEFRRRGMPLALINNCLPTENNAFILDDNYNGAAEAMRYLIEDCGHTNIAIMTDRLSHSSYLTRYYAYIDTLAAHGLLPYSNPAFAGCDLFDGYELSVPQLMCEFGVEHVDIEGTPIFVRKASAHNAASAVLRLLETGRLPTAIFAATDSIAIGALSALKSMNVRVPEDIAVIGYDDIPAAEFTDPPLTTVRVDREEIGRAAVRALAEQIKEPSLPSRTIIIKNELIIRQST